MGTDSMKNLQPPTQFIKDFFEFEAWNEQKVVCGVDEVGRGCLAGPVLTAAVILHPYADHPELKDSKILDASTRTEVANWIYKHSWYGFGWAPILTIDRYNIYQATLRAMKRAIMQANAQNHPPLMSIVVDAMPISFSQCVLTLPIHSAPKGEYWSRSIAAASIIAKVKRDTLMQQLALYVPGYTLEEHKGYATSTHCNELRAQGASFLHRQTFLHKVLLETKESDERNQGSIC